jgi:nucleoside-diphosphate-sugar epimerase
VLSRAAGVDLRDGPAVRESLRAARPEVVFHCAMTAGHPKDAAARAESLGTSVVGTAHVAEAAAEVGVRRFVHLGSFLVYRRAERALVESDPIEPGTFRGVAKAAAALWLQQFARETHFPAVELRIFSVYGPGEPRTRFIPTLLDAALTSKTLPLRCGPRHDFVFVDDVVEACLLAASADVSPGDVFNVGSGSLHANEEVVDVARRATGRAIHVDEGAYPPSPADATHWQADIRAARERLGWAPAHSLAEGLAVTYEWMRKSAVTA